MNAMVFIDDNKQDIVIAWIAALLIHLLFFSLSGKIFIKSPQFAIAPSREIEINLIDEPREMTQVQKEAKPVIKTARRIAPKIAKPAAKLSVQVKAKAKLDYIQNPPPPYPELARQMRQEGIVMLSVDVDRTGKPVRVEIIQSSGYHLLDQAALKAVSHWKFQPESMGNVSIESTVTIPIRFRLEK
jgi:protein TonB